MGLHRICCTDQAEVIQAEGLKIEGDAKGWQVTILETGERREFPWPAPQWFNDPLWNQAMEVVSRVRSGRWNHDLPGLPDGYEWIRDSGNPQIQHRASGTFLFATLDGEFMADRPRAPAHDHPVVVPASVVQALLDAAKKSFTL